MDVVCIVGLPGSGKSEVLSILQKRGIPTFNMGDVITKIEPSRRGIKDVTEDVENEIRQDIRKQHGPAAVAVIAAEELEKTGASLVAIGGLHTFAELDYFKKRFGDSFRLVAIKTPLKTRISRLGCRKERPLGREELEKRERRYNEQFDLHQLVERAETVIDNSGSLGDLKKRVREIAEAVGKRI